MKKQEQKQHKKQVGAEDAEAAGGQVGADGRSWAGLE